MTNDPADRLSLALDATGQVIAAVHDEQWPFPTPCREWNLRDLVTHVVTGNYLFEGMLRSLPPAPRDSWPRSGLLDAYRGSAVALLTAFRQPGVLEQVFTVPIGTIPGIVALHLRITEVLVHGWDIARATRQRAEFPEDLAEQELAFSRSKLTYIPPGRQPFALPQPVADDAPAIDRLAACLGRSQA